MTRRPLPSGVTLVEIIVAMTLTLAVFAITLPFVRVQTEALGTNASRLDAEQIARYAQRLIDKEVRLAVADAGQPLLVYAGPMTLAFNVNLVAKDALDPGALEIDDAADSTETEAWYVASAAEIPNSGLTYPTVDYADAAGAHSHNETVMYFLHADTVSGRSDVYVLYRRVNALDSVQVVRGIHVPADSAFFSYQTMVSGALTTLATSALPIAWDTIAIDDIRAVQMRAAGFFRNRQSGEDVIRTIYWVTRLVNSRASIACDGAPAVPSDAAFTLTKATATRPYRLTFNWTASVDDGSLTTTATHYVIERRLSSGSVWSGVATIPATQRNTYSWTQYLPIANVSYVYGIRVIGCDGAVSAQKLWTAVTLP